MSRFGKILLFGSGIALVFTAITSLIITNINSKPEPIQAEPVRSPNMDGQDLTALLETHQTPKIVKCNFTGTYKVEQDIAFSRNGAKCDDFETRTMKLNSVSAECTTFLDPKQELFLSCTNPTNPVTKCNGIVFVYVGGKRACEYWVTIQRVE